MSPELRHSPDVALEEIFVWAVEPSRMELSLDFSVRQAAELECELMQAPFAATSDDERAYIRNEWPTYRGLTGELEGSVTVSASVTGDELKIGRVEDLYL